MRMSSLGMEGGAAERVSRRARWPVGARRWLKRRMLRRMLKGICTVVRKRLLLRRRSRRVVLVRVVNVMEMVVRMVIAVGVRIEVVLAVGVVEVEVEIAVGVGVGIAVEAELAAEAVLEDA